MAVYKIGIGDWGSGAGEKEQVTYNKVKKVGLLVLISLVTYYFYHLGINSMLVISQPKAGVLSNANPISISPV